MRRARLLTAALSVLLVPLLQAPATAIADEATSNPWLEMRVMNMAHSGGEHEAPMNTMYAFKRAEKVGADMLELDVQSTADGQLVVLHNSTVDETTNGTGYVKDMTLEQVQSLDAAHWFVDGRSAVHGLPDSSYPLRGARYGQPKVPGYKNKDFRIPTLKEIFRAFPNTPINIEIKGTNDADIASFLRTGRLLATFLNKSGRTDVIVASFKDEALVDFHRRAPQIGLSPGMGQLIAYFLGGVRPMEGTVALQVPVRYAGIQVVTRPFVERAHRDGYAVHAWFSGTAPDDAATYSQVVDACVDGLMPAKPTVLEQVLDERGIERPGVPGVDPCAG